MTLNHHPTTTPPPHSRLPTSAQLPYRRQCGTLSTTALPNPAPALTLRCASPAAPPWPRVRPPPGPCLPAGSHPPTVLHAGTAPAPPRAAHSAHSQRATQARSGLRAGLVAIAQARPSVTCRPATRLTFGSSAGGSSFAAARSANTHGGENAQSGQAAEKGRAGSLAQGTCSAESGCAGGRGRIHGAAGRLRGRRWP